MWSETSQRWEESFSTPTDLPTFYFLAIETGFATEGRLSKSTGSRDITGNS
jgi:hypothetical protein